jgi:2'-5' RNA ligase
VPLDGNLRIACGEQAEWLRNAGVEARWVRPENYHLTLAFLGRVEVERIAIVEDAVRAAVSQIEPFRLQLEAVGAFPNRRQARVIWIGAAARVAQFDELAATIRAALEAHGFSFPQPAEPHVTLARAGGCRFAATQPQKLPPLMIDEAVLYESFTEAAGVRYAQLASFLLHTT